MSDRQAPQDPDYAARIGDSSEAQVEELLKRARQGVIPAAVIALIIIAVAFTTTAKKEGVRKSNAVAYEALQVADGFDDPSERDADKQAENRSKVRGVLESVVADHAGTVAADEAAMRLAALELTDGNFEKAAAAFGEVAVGSTDVNRADTAAIGKANALIGLEKFDDALVELTKIAGRSESIFAVEAAYRAAVVSYRKGDVEGARKHLDAVLAADDNAEVKQMATSFQERLDLFDADAVKASFVAPEPEPEAAAVPDAVDGEKKPE